MSVKTILPRLNNAGKVAGAGGLAQTDDNWSPGIWADCPILAIQEGEWPGIISEFRFDSLPKTPATTEGNFGLFTQYAGATTTVGVDAGGHGWDITSTASGDGFGLRFRATPFRLDRSLGKFWFEARIKSSSITDALSQIFVGLIEDTTLGAAVPFASASALSNNNLVGFFKAGTGAGSGAAMSTTYKASGVTAVTVGSNQVTLTAATWTKLGMLFLPSVDPLAQDPNFQGTTKYNVYFYQDGVRLAGSKQIPVAQGTDFPNSVYMSPVVSWLAKNSTPDVFAVSAIRAVQVFSPGFVL